MKDHIIPSSKYDELEEELGEDWSRVFKPLAIVSQSGSTVAKTSDGWKEVLKSVDKQSPGNNSVNI